MKINTVVRYTIIGTIIGFMFPIGGTLWDLFFIRNIPITLDNIILAQVTNPMHWIIDSAPLMLGSFAALAGSRQNRAEILSIALEAQLEESHELSSALGAARNSLEAEIKERTSELDRRAQFLQAAASVGQAATSIYNLDEMLPQVTNLISDRFGFYHAGIFMLDESGEYALLKAANSEGGKRMLARGHRLKVGQEGIVGFVSGTGESRIALDVGTDAIHFDNPDMPDTRSEMGLPLISGGRMMGVLDVQSREANAFSEEDVAALEVLADQVAMAINNAELFDQLEKSVNAERKAYGEVSLESWRNLLSGRDNLGYQFNGNTISPTSGDWPQDMQAVANSSSSQESFTENGLAFNIPIQVRGNNIGVIRLMKDEPELGWTNEEKELLEELGSQLGPILESARLFEETQRKAMNEQVVSEISSRTRETLDIESILKTAAEELRLSLDLPEVSVRLISETFANSQSNQNGQKEE